MRTYMKEGLRVKIKYHGKLLRPQELAKELDLSVQTIYNRLRKGVPHEALISRENLKRAENGHLLTRGKNQQAAQVAGLKKYGSKVVQFPKGFVPPPLVDLGKLVTPVRLAIAGAISSEEYLELENRIYNDEDGV